MWEGYNRISSAGGYQLDGVASNGGTVTGDLFANGALPGTVHMTPYRTIDRVPTAQEAAWAQSRYAYTGLHETFHLASQGGYSDEEMARAAYSLAGKQAPNYGKNDVLNWSARFDDFLGQHCPNDTTPKQKAMSVRTIALIIFLLSPTLFLVSNTEAQGWRGILPLHSTRADVERLLGPPSEQLAAYSVRYRTPDATVVIDYAQGLPCGIGEKYSQWRVPRNTVESIFITPRMGSPLSQLRIDKTKYKERSGGHRPDDIYYVNEQGGESLRVFQNQVMEITYSASASDEHLRCPGIPSSSDNNCGNLAPPSFDAYSELSLEQEKQRLDNFVIVLLDEKGRRGYIIAYAGRRARVGEANVHVLRAKNYLVNVRHFPANRLTVIDGGYREQAEVDLYIVSEGTCPPNPSPKVDPRDVKTVKASGSSARKRHPRQAMQLRQLN